MKVTLHIPTEQYGFIEIESEGTPKEAREAYDMYAKAFKSGEGLSQKEMADYIFNALHSIKGPIMVEMWEKMSPSQQSDVRALRNAMERKLPTEEKTIE